MKKLQYYLTFALLCLMTACNPRASQPQFEFQLFDQDGSLSYSKIYTLTNSHLSITIRHGLTSDQDSTVFVLAIPSGNLIIDTLSRIDFSSLNENYSSDCIEDGTLLDLYIKRDGLKQHVHITNYYLRTIVPIIDYINSITPLEYNIWYDKRELIKRMQACQPVPVPMPGFDNKTIKSTP